MTQSYVKKRNHPDSSWRLEVQDNLDRKLCAYFDHAKRVALFTALQPIFLISWSSFRLRQKPVNAVYIGP